MEIGARWLAIDFGGEQFGPGAGRDSDGRGDDDIVPAEETLPVAVQRGLQAQPARHVARGIAQAFRHIGADIGADILWPRLYLVVMAGQKADRAQDLERFVGAGAIR